MLFIYFISSLFRRSPAPSDGNNTTATSYSAHNIYSKMQTFDLYVYVKESEVFENFDEGLFWMEDGLNYGDWTSGINEDGSFEKSSTLEISERVINNGTIFMHTFMVKSGTSPNPKDEGYDKLYAIHRFKQLNKYKKKVYHTTTNLLTGTHQ